MIFTIPKRHNEMKINKVGLLVICFFGVARKYNADIMVVIAFGQILPKEILEMNTVRMRECARFAASGLSWRCTDPVGSDQWRESIRCNDHADE